MSVDPQDLVDVGFTTQDELQSAGGAADAYRTGVTVVSTTSGTKYVVVSGYDPTGLAVGSRDAPVEVGDRLVLAGTTGGADGQYTIAAVIDDTTVKVAETIATSTGGTAEFRYPPGAGKVGLDTTNFVIATASDLQSVLAELDGAIFYTRLWGADDVTKTTTTRFLYPGMIFDVAPVTAISTPEISSGFVRRLTVKHHVVGGGSENIVYTVWLDGSPTALTVTLAANASTNSDLVNVVSFTAGQRLDIAVTKAGSLSGSRIQGISAVLEVVN